jgi:hypothetical protein
MPGLKDKASRAAHGGDRQYFNFTDSLHRAERLHQHRDLHYIKPDYITDLNINVKLYDYIKLQARFLSSSTSPTKTSPRSTSTWSSAAADKNPAAAAYDKTRRRRDLRSPPPPTTKPAAAVIFDHRRRLRQDPPPLQNRCRRHLKTRRRHRIPAAAA